MSKEVSLQKINFAAQSTFQIQLFGINVCCTIIVEVKFICVIPYLYISFNIIIIAVTRLMLHL